MLCAIWYNLLNFVKLPMNKSLFLKITPSMGVFHAFKLQKWYQIVHDYLISEQVLIPIIKRRWKRIKPSTTSRKLLHYVYRLCRRAIPIAS